MRTKLSTLAAASLMLGAALAIAPPSAAQAASACTGFSYVPLATTSTRDAHTPTLGNGTGNRNCYLIRGNRGVAVVVLQEALVYCYGQYVGPAGIDGDFGTNTKNALMNAQRKINELFDWQHTTVDGEYGPQTRELLMGPIFAANGGPRIPDAGCTYPG